MTATEARYIEEYGNVLLGVYDCTKFVNERLARCVEELEATIGCPARVEELREIARLG